MRKLTLLVIFFCVLNACSTEQHFNDCTGYEGGDDFSCAFRALGRGLDDVFDPGNW